jgi:hypothetical protein
LREEPSKGDLRRRRLLLLREPANQVNHSLICFSVLRRKARNHVAEVGLVELGVLADLASEEALPQRAKWNEPDSEFLEGR